MKSLRTLQEEQKAQFDTQGYLIVKGLFAPVELEEMDRTFEEIS
jgi:phytanoyl-CoA hydroxylase